MESRAKLLGHPIHTMLVFFPVGLLATAAIFDIVFLVTRTAALSQSAYYLISAGIIGGLVASPFGWDWFAIPAGTRAMSVGLLHGAGNMLVLILFLISWLLRHNAPVDPRAAAYVCSFAAAGLAIVTGWLSGELVDRLGIGVDKGANPNASSSLSGRSASEQ